EVAERARQLGRAGQLQTAGRLPNAGEHASEEPHTAGKITRPGAFSPVPPSRGPPPLLSPTLSDIGAQETQAGRPSSAAIRCRGGRGHGRRDRRGNGSAL